MKTYIKPTFKVANIDAESMLATSTSPTVGGNLKGSITTQPDGATPLSGGGHAKSFNFLSDNPWDDDVNGNY